MRPDRVLEELRQDSLLMNVDSFEDDYMIEEPPPLRGAAFSQLMSITHGSRATVMPCGCGSVVWLSQPPKLA